MRAVRTMATAVVAVAMAVVLVGACSSSSPSSSSRSSNRAQSSVKSACLLTAADAEALLGASVKEAAPEPLTGIAAPTSRCLYNGPSGSSVELTAFKGTDLFTQLSRLVGNATAVAGMGESGYCGGGQGPTLASYSCLFVKNASTYVLAVQVPNDQDGDVVHERVKTSALDLARRAPAAA